MILNSDEFDKVIGEIYKITNTVTQKSYIGQTRSHRLNHSKYRPFGHLGRLKDHISEANSEKKNQSWYLNSAILKYGAEKFVCEKILECKLNELDDYESLYISEYKTKYPNGYNLTDGGQKGANLRCEKIILNESEIVKPEPKEKRSVKRSDETKKLMSERLIEAKKDESHRKKMMLLTQTQHLKQKFDRFKDVTVDESKMDDYIRVKLWHSNQCEYVVVKIKNVQTSFIGKTEQIEDIKERARTFIKELIKWQHNQIAGTFLETSQTTSLLETTDEGTRVMTDPNGKTGEVLDNPQPSS
jgi:group I intron endonuclease